MPELDEFSQAFGRMEGEIRQQAISLGVIQDGIKEIRNYQLQQNGKIDKVHRRQADLVLDFMTLKAEVHVASAEVAACRKDVESVSRDTAAAKADAADWKDTKKKAQLLIGLGVFGAGAGGIGIGKVLAVLLG